VFHNASSAAQSASWALFAIYWIWEGCRSAAAVVSVATLGRLLTINLAIRSGHRLIESARFVM
jgi:hypothetical protein